MIVFFENTTEILQSIPPSLWQFKAGFASEKPSIIKVEQDQEQEENKWEESSIEKYFLTQEEDKTFHRSVDAL